MTITTTSATTNDLRVTEFRPLVTPADLRADLPLGDRRADLVASSRSAVADVLAGRDDRLLTIVGPCSVHDPEAALDYARRLAATTAELSDRLLVVMRVYFEKPRTTVGWKGLINDPGLDGSHDVDRGLRTARSVLLGVLDTGLPVGCEFLEPTSPQYIADTVSWGAIGARTPESQVHRQLASGLSMPIGFKNATDGDIQAAIDGGLATAQGQVFFGVDHDGRAAVVTTTGNPDGHVILRGGRRGPNFGRDDVVAAADLLAANHRHPRLVVDASHANSNKDHVRQVEVVHDLADQVASGSTAVAGVMIESFLEAGRQDPGTRPLIYGRSITDACIDWPTTDGLLHELASAATARRRVMR